MDPIANVVVFQLRDDEELLEYELPAEDGDEVRAAWRRVREDRPDVSAADVAVVSTVWKPSAEDEAFVATTFPGAELTPAPPRPDSLDDAVATLVDTAAQLGAGRGDGTEDGAAEAAEAATALATAGINPLGPDDDGYTLLPALLAEPDERLGPMVEQLPDALYLTVGKFGWTERRTIRWEHLAHEDGAVAGVPVARVLEFAWENLSGGIQLTASDAEPTPDTVLEISRDGGMASAIVTQPGFAERIGSILGADRLVVGIPCQDTAWVTGADSAGAGTVYEYVREHRHTDYLVPSVYLVDRAGIQLLDRLGDGTSAAPPRRQLTPRAGSVGLATSNVPCHQRPAGTDEVPLAEVWPAGTGAS